jgi:hypothetical protein
MTVIHEFTFERVGGRPRGRGYPDSEIEPAHISLFDEHGKYVANDLPFDATDTQIRFFILGYKGGRAAGLMAYNDMIV